MCHIHTSIVSRHLATRGNNKILRTPPLHISNSEEILPCRTRRTFVQLRTNKSPFLKSYLHKIDANTDPSPLYILCSTHIHDTHRLFNCTHIVTPGFVDRPRRSGWPDGRRSWLVDHKLEHRTPPTSKGHGRGILQSQSHDCLIDMPLPYGCLLHPQAALTNCKSQVMQH